MAYPDSPKFNHDSLAKKLAKAQHENNHISMYDPVIMRKVSEFFFHNNGQNYTHHFLIRTVIFSCVLYSNSKQLEFI